MESLEYPLIIKAMELTSLMFVNPKDKPNYNEEELLMYLQLCRSVRAYMKLLELNTDISYMVRDEQFKKMKHDLGRDEEGST